LIQGHDALIGVFNPGWKNPNLYEGQVRGTSPIIGAVERADSKRVLWAGGAGGLALTSAPGSDSTPSRSTRASDDARPCAGRDRGREEDAAEDGAGAGREAGGESVWSRPHELPADLTLALVVLHVGGVALASVARREDLVRTMVTVRKRAA
jgi:cytochrome b